MAFKVLTLVGTRPEIIKLSRVIVELSRQFQHVLVHSGQNYDYELNEIFFEQLQLPKPNHFLSAAGETAAQTIGNVITRFDAVLAAEQPDAMLVLGDTNSALGMIAAKRRRIPVFHMEAGNRCFDDRVPEEINRRIIDHASDINLVYSEHARRHLLAEGRRPETVIKTGSPMREVLEFAEPGVAASTVLADLQLVPGEYFVVSMHREENVDDPAHFRSLLQSLNRLALESNWPVVVSTHPRTRKRLDARGHEPLDARVRLLKPLGFFDYIHLQRRSACVVSDSGTLTEEAAILGFPAVMIRQSHERPEGMDEAVAILSGLNPERVMQAVALARKQAASGFRPHLVEDYAADRVSVKVARLILSYTDYVNQTVWRRGWS